MTRLVVIVPFAIPDLQKALTDYFVRLKCEYWHWCAECWLVCSNNELSVQQVRDHFMASWPNVQIVILKVEMPIEGPNWGLYGPVEWGEWFRTRWEMSLPEKIEKIR